MTIKRGKKGNVLETPWTRQICAEMEEYAAIVIVHHGNRYVANMPDRQVIWKGLIAFIEFKGVDTPWTLGQRLVMQNIAKRGEGVCCCYIAREAGTKPGEKPYGHLCKVNPRGHACEDLLLVGAFSTGKQLLDLLN